MVCRLIPEEEGLVIEKRVIFSRN